MGQGNVSPETFSYLWIFTILWLSVADPTESTKIPTIYSSHAKSEESAAWHNTNMAKMGRKLNANPNLDVTAFHINGDLNLAENM